KHGYICFDAAKPNAKERKQLQIIAEYTKMSQAKSRLNRIIKAYELCARLCGIEKGHGSKVCFNYHIKQCHGACGQLEEVESYNERAEEAMDYLKTVFEHDFILVDQGRNNQEKTVIWVHDGEYQGYGYLDVSEGIHNVESMKDCVNTRFESNPEVKKIIRRFLLDGTLKVIKL
ncbi:MAG: DNA polymerase III subunit epsilon, partial [Bacteroidota bacterium]